MKTPEFEKWTVRKLSQHLLKRRFAVPKLQRNFVWEASRAAKLLDSIYYQMPIGSLFLWEMDKKSAPLIRQAANVLPPFSMSNPRIWFVIDGQQRLSVIHQAFRGERRINDRGRAIDFSRLCFVVKPEGDEPNPPRIVYRKPVDREYVPLKDILAPDWRHRMPTDAQWFLAKIEDCRARILTYPLPVVLIQSATLPEIGEVFTRLNAQGMKVTTADRAIALMGELDVRAMAEELRHRIRDAGIALPSIDPILMGFNLVAEKLQRGGDPPSLESMARRWSRTIKNDKKELARFKKQWARYQEAFSRAVEYLKKRFPVYDESFIPSLNMLATLSVFFFHRMQQPTGAQAAEIRKWFWATGVGQRYTGGGYHTNIVSDAILFRELADGRPRKFQYVERLDPVADVQMAAYGSRSARTRAFFCLLAAQNPRYLENGETIPIATNVISHSDSRHRHHIFPQAQMAKRFRPRDYNSLVNICFLVAQNNQSIGKRLPRSYLADYRAANAAGFRRTMKSHLIPAGGEAAVWQSGIRQAFKQFRRERLSLICNAFEHEAGIKLFRNE